MKSVSYTRMSDATRQDFELLGREGAPFFSAVPERIIAAMGSLTSTFVGHQISILEHMLQTATRAAQEGADEDMIVGALLHDFGDLFAPHNHSEFAAALIRPYVREEVYWVVRHHGIFQLYYRGRNPDNDPNRRKRYRNSPHYDACVAFCERWDQASFDPGYRSFPLEYFAPIVRRVFARRPFPVDLLGADGAKRS